MSYSDLFTLPFNTWGAIQFKYSPIIPDDRIIHDTNTNICYVGNWYRLLIFVAYKEDFDLAIKKCFEFATRRIDEYIEQKIIQELNKSNT